MRRLLFLYTPLIQMGGAQRNFIQEIQHFRGRGVACEAITLGSTADGPDVADVETIAITRAPQRTPLGEVLTLRKAIRTFRPELLVAHTSPELAYVATRGTRVPYVLYLSSPPFYKGYPENRAIYAWRYRRLLKSARAARGPRYREFLPDVRLTPFQRLDVEARAVVRTPAVRNADAVIVWSERTAREFNQVYGINPVVVYGCIPDALTTHVARTDVRHRFQLKNGSRVVLTVSRLDPIKRIDLLIRAFHLVKPQCPDAVLVIVGTGPDEARLRALAANLGTSDVVFAGYVPDSDVWDYYATSNVFVTPALADFNIAPFEALALQCPVIWSSEMETDIALHQVGAVTTADPDADHFAEAIVRTLKAPRPRRWDMTPYLLSTRYATLAALYDRIIAS